MTGDSNLYRYCNNDPTSTTDPSGFFPGIQSEPAIKYSGFDDRSELNKDGNFGFDITNSGTSNGNNAITNNVITSELTNGIESNFGFVFGNSTESGGAISLWNPGAPFDLAV